MSVFEDIQKQHEEFDKKLRSARQISRNNIYKIVLLCAGIVGFSVSLFSIPIFQGGLNLVRFKYAWYIFTVVIITGLATLILEGRMRYAIAWKGYQVMKFKDKISDYSFKERLMANIIAIITLIYPANLIFNKIYTNSQEKEHKEYMNGLVVNKLARTEMFLISMLENIFIIAFILGLFVLVSAFKV